MYSPFYGDRVEGQRTDEPFSTATTPAPSFLGRPDEP
jgi:hypothetical protein